MHRHTLLLSAMLALAVPSAASATQGDAAAMVTSARAGASASAYRDAPADMRVAIILQRKPAKKGGK